MASHILKRWDPEDPAFWESEGRVIANRNLWISIPSLSLSFAVWMVWSAVVVNLPNAGFDFTTRELLWLCALPALCGATLRIFYSFMVPIFGGRRWTAISTASLLVPALGMGFALRDPSTSYSTFAVLALLCGLGGGNFASSMANITFFFPKVQKGTALGLIVGLGHLGVSLAQFAVPLVITAGVFGALGGDPQLWMRGDETKQMWLQNAGFIWVPFIAIFAIAAWFGMHDLAADKALLPDPAAIFRRGHTWIMCWLYLGTFGSFVGYSAAFPLLIKSEFPQISALSYAWLGPLVGALVRPLGGWLADELGGAKVTFWSFIAMVLGVTGMLAFLPQGGQGGDFYSFLATSMLLFAAAGVGNGSTFRMIPAISLYRRQREAAGRGREAEEQAVRDANKEATTVLGFCSAIGAYGGFFVPMSYGSSIAATGGPILALCGFIVFYVSCIATTWWCYSRRRAEMPC